MPGTKFIENFNCFQNITGIPKLVKTVNFKTAHVKWSPGSIHFRQAFARCLDMNEMREMIIDTFFEQQRELYNRRSNYNIDGVRGSVVYVPHGVAEDIHQVVRRYFYRALEIMEREGEVELEEDRWSVARETQSPGQIKRRLEV